MLNQKGIAHIIALIVLVAGLLIGLYLVQHPAIFKPKANTYPTLGAQTSISLRSSNYYPTVGEEISVNVVVRSDTYAINLIDILLDFPPTSLEAISATLSNTEGPLIDLITGELNNTRGTIHLVGTIPSPGKQTQPYLGTDLNYIPPDSYFVILRFRVKATGITQTKVNLSSSLYRDSDNSMIPYTVDNLIVVSQTTPVISPTPSVTPTPTLTPTPTPTPTPIASTNSCSMNLTQGQTISGQVLTTTTGTRSNSLYYLSLWAIGSKYGDFQLFVDQSNGPMNGTVNSAGFYNNGPATLECRIQTTQSGGTTIFSKSVTVNVENVISTPAPTSTTICNFPLTLCPDHFSCGLRISSGFSTCPGAPFPSITPMLMGDGNGDGRVNLADLSMLLTNFNRFGSFPGLDFNSDGKINSFDYSSMKDLLRNQGLI